MNPDPIHLRVWRWVVASRRAVLGWGLALIGAVALFLGWYGVSGTAITAKQLPYLVSGGLTGVALVVLAAAILATEDMRRQVGQVKDLKTKIDTLYELLVEPDLPVDEQPVDEQPVDAESADELAAALVAVPGGTSYHRPTCGLVVGKDTTKRLSRRRIVERGLHPCRICDPAPVATS